MPTIADIQTIPFRLPMTGSLKWGQASRMDEVEHVLVRLVTDTGEVGLAEAPPRPTIYGETVESIQTIIHKHLAPMLKGLSIDEIPMINQRMNTIANNHTAKGAIDICLHEALALNQGLTLFEIDKLPLTPIFQHLKTKVKVSYILGIADRQTMLNEARAIYDKGVRVFKVKVGRNFAEDMTRLKELQSEFRGSAVSFYADANECLINDPIKQLRQLAEVGVLYVEEPMPIEMIPTRISIGVTNILPIIADDSVFTLRDLKRELGFDTFDILNIKTARTGYAQSQEMFDLARTFSKGVMVGSQASSTLGTIRTAIFAAQSGIDYPCELSFFLKLKDDIVNHPIEIVDGYIELATLRDITLDEARLQHFAINF